MANLALLALVWVWFSGAVLWVLNALLQFIASLSTASFAKSGAWQASVQGAVARYVKPGLYSILGQDGRFSYKLEHILLLGVLTVLLGIWRSIHISNTYLARADRARKEGDKKEASGGSKKAQ